MRRYNCKGILKTKLENYINKNKLNKNVKLLNFVENPYNYIKQTDLFILSSKYEVYQMCF